MFEFSNSDLPNTQVDITDQEFVNTVGTSEEYEDFRTTLANEENQLNTEHQPEFAIQQNDHKYALVLYWQKKEGLIQQN